MLNSKSFDYCTDGHNKFKIHIFNFSSKVETIEIIRKLMDISDNSIYTIGDGSNDIEMIKKYNGFILGDGIDECDIYALQRYESFPLFLEDVQKGLIKKRR